VRRQVYSYLPLPPFDRYQITMLGDRGTTCPRLLPEKRNGWDSNRRPFESQVQRSNHSATRPQDRQRRKMFLCSVQWAQSVSDASWRARTCDRGHYQRTVWNVRYNSASWWTSLPVRFAQRLVNFTCVDHFTLYVIWAAQMLLCSRVTVSFNGFFTILKSL